MRDRQRKRYRNRERDKEGRDRQKDSLRQMWSKPQRHQKRNTETTTGTNETVRVTMPYS